MTASTSDHPLRERALRSIGRNVVNFQRLEQCIKFLSRFSDTEGPLVKVLKNEETRINGLSKFTMGQAVSEIARIIQKDQRPLPITQDLFEPWISRTFDCPLDPVTARIHCDELSALVNERNDLVHNRLAAVDLDSAEQCARLSEELDAQNKRILKQLEMFGPLVAALREMLTEAEEYINSPEFLAQLQGAAK